MTQSGHYWWCGCLGELCGLSHDGHGGHDGPSFSTLVESSVPQLITLDPMDAMMAMESIWGSNDHSFSTLVESRYGPLVLWAHGDI